MHQISQTLAGRCAVLYLLPFSRAELECQEQAEPHSPAEIFANRTTHLDLWPTIHAGFYPRIHDRGIPPGIWLNDYVQTYVERDVRSLVNIGDLERFERFLRLCAGRVGQLLNYSGLATDCGISVDTARRWISVLKTSFIISLMVPHHQNFRKRVIKSPKLYFHDTGLACHLQGIRSVEQLQTHPLRGNLFENYIVSEIEKAYRHHRLNPPMFFWRDKTGHEVDLIIDDVRGLYPIEIKSGQTVARDMFAGLLWWSCLATQSPARATLVYGGGDAYARQDIAVRPWFSI
jgi:predicted AAA+ superfamily ATPase